MTEIDAVARKWGDSLAVIIPHDIVKKEKIQANQKIHVILRREIDLSDLFGALKTKKTAHHLKEEGSQGWE